MIVNVNSAVTPATYGTRMSAAGVKDRVLPDDSQHLGDWEECSLESICNAIGFAVDSLSANVQTKNKLLFHDGSVYNHRSVVKGLDLAKGLGHRFHLSPQLPREST